MELVQDPMASPRKRRGGEADAEKKACEDGGPGWRAARRRCAPRRKNPFAGKRDVFGAQKGTSPGFSDWWICLLEIVRRFCFSVSGKGPEVLTPLTTLQIHVRHMPTEVVTRGVPSEKCKKRQEK